MARKLRIEYPGAIYHVMNCGDRREAIFLADQDRELFVATLAEACCLCFRLVRPASRWTIDPVYYASGRVLIIANDSKATSRAIMWLTMGRG